MGRRCSWCKDLWSEIGEYVTYAAIGITGPIGALIYAGYELYKNWDSICSWCEDLWNNFCKIPDKVAKAFESLGDFFADVWQSIYDTFFAPFESALDFFTSSVDKVKNFGSSVSDTVSQGFDSAKEFGSNLWDGVTGYFSGGDTVPVPAETLASANGGENMRGEMEIKIRTEDNVKAEVVRTKTSDNLKTDVSTGRMRGSYVPV